jgi:hypothetical protein
MEEKGFRIVECPNCGLKHRIEITEADYGKTGTVKCKNTPTCRTTFRVTIPTPPVNPSQKPESDPPPGFDFGDAINYLFGWPKKK